MADIQLKFPSSASTNSVRADEPKEQSDTAPPPAPSVPAAVVFPDGGTKAWLTVFGTFLAMFCTFGQLNSFGTFQTFYAENQLKSLPPSTIAWIGSLQLWIFFFSGGVVGRLHDAWGPRPILAAGTLILVFGTMMTSISSRYYSFILAQGLVVGVGIGTIFYPSLSAVSTFFLKKRSLAIGVAASGSGLGGVVWPIMYQRLFATIGFGWTVRATGFITLALCGVTVMTVSSNLKTPRQSMPWFDVKMFRDFKFMLLVTGSIPICLGLFVPSFYVVDYAIAHGVDPQTAFYALAVLNAGGIFGRIIPPALADRYGRYNAMIPCIVLMGLSALVFWPFAKTVVAIMLFAAFFGFFQGAFNVLIIPCVAQISDIREIGTRVGVIYSIVSFPTLAGGPAAGVTIKDESGSYIGMMILTGVSLLAGSIFFVWTRLILSRELTAHV